MDYPRDLEFHVSINCTSDVSSKEIKIDIQMRQLNKVHSIAQIIWFWKNFMRNLHIEISDFYHRH